MANLKTLELTGMNPTGQSGQQDFQLIKLRLVPNPNLSYADPNANDHEVELNNRVCSSALASSHKKCGVWNG